MATTKLPAVVLSSLLLVGALTGGVRAASAPLGCDLALLALLQEIRQICTPRTAEDVLKTTWPGGIQLGTPCYAAADAYYAAVIAAKSVPSVILVRAKICEQAGLMRME